MSQTAPATSNDIVIANVLELGRQIFDDERKEAPVVKLLADTGTAKMRLLIFHTGQALPEHHVPSPIHVQVLEGEITFTTPSGSVFAPAGTLLHLDADVPHSLVAHSPALILVTALQVTAPA